MSFGKNLESLRKGNKMSQEKLGKSLGLTQQMISSYEKGQSSPNVEVLCKIADLFQVSLDYLVNHPTISDKADNSENRLVEYFSRLSQSDREKTLLIIQTLLADRGIQD